MKTVTDLLTGVDGVTHDIGRWSWASSLAALFAVTGHQTWTGQAVDFVAFGTAVGAIVGAHGVALYAKRDTEPKPPETTP